jgi:hypothetical protein
MIGVIEVSTMSPEARIKALQDAPRNGWVAFSENEDRVVAYASSYDEVVELSEKNGVSDPVIVKVPDNWNELAL